MTEDSKVKRLLSTREGYDEEVQRDKFLLDAYAGTGGFSGSVRTSTTGYWGPAAEMYSSDLASLDFSSAERAKSYLDRFTREDGPKFEGRIDRSHYPNHIANVIDIPLSYLNRKPMIYRVGDEEADAESGDGMLPESVQAWLDDCDGSGTTWQHMKQDTIQLRARVLGWCPVLIDMPRVSEAFDEEGNAIERTRADDIADGVRTKAFPLFPANLLDWDLDEHGRFIWCKVVTHRTLRPDPLGESIQQIEVRIWFRDEVWIFILQMVESENATGWAIVYQDIAPHDFGEVPIAVFKDKPIPDEAVRGMPSAKDASIEAKRLYNLHSELDEFLRACAFGLLQVPMKKPEDAGKLVIGSNNAVGVHPDSRVDLKWILPETAVSEMYENRIAATVEEIHRMGKIEYSRGKTKGGAQSGVSRAFEFEATNRSISDFAANVARAEEMVLKLATGVAVNVVAPTRFDVEEMSKELEETLTALSLPIGPTAVGELVTRMLDKLLPNVEPAIREKMHTEIMDAADTKAKLAEQLRQAASEAGTFGAGDDDDEGDDDPDDDSDDDSNADDE